jgi:hypothetical protein
VIILPHSPERLFHGVNTVFNLDAPHLVECRRGINQLSFQLMDMRTKRLKHNTGFYDTTLRDHHVILGVQLIQLCNTMLKVIYTIAKFVRMRTADIILVMWMFPRTRVPTVTKTNEKLPGKLCFSCTVLFNLLKSSPVEITRRRSRNLTPPRVTLSTGCLEMCNSPLSLMICLLVLGSYW